MVIKGSTYKCGKDQVSRWLFCFFSLQMVITINECHQFCPMNTNTGCNESKNQLRWGIRLDQEATIEVYYSLGDRNLVEF